jgi:F0F1-type ATP synthase delta subunit
LAEKLLLKKTGRKKIVVEVARNQGSASMLKSLAKKGDIIQEKVEASIVAGVKITINDEQQLDVTLKSKIEKLFS